MKKYLSFLLLPISLMILTSCTSNPTFIFNKEKTTTIQEKEDIPDSFGPKDISIVSVGDSLTQGVGDSTNNGGYVPYLKNELEANPGINEATITNYGVRGNRSDQLLKKIKTDEVKQSIQDADSVIITIGGNDIMKVVRSHFSHLKVEHFSNQLKTYESNLYEIVKTIRQENPTSIIVLVGVYNPFMKMFSDIQEMNEIVNEWNETSQTILTLFDQTYFVGIEDLFFSENEQLLYEDYFHPNDKGYELIAERIYEKMDEKAIEEILKKK